MKQNDYYSSIHRLGRWSTLIGIALMFMVPIAATIIYDVNLNTATIVAAAIQLCIVFIPTQLTEVISFSPILGAGGTYLSFITGNVMNMKLPAAAAGHRLMNVEPHSDEGEVVSVLAIGMSSITTTLIIFAGMFLYSFYSLLRVPRLKARLQQRYAGTSWNHAAALFTQELSFGHHSSHHQHFIRSLVCRQIRPGPGISASYDNDSFSGCIYFNYKREKQIR